MIGPLVDKEIKISEEQKDILGRLNSLLFTAYHDVILESMINAKEPSEESEDFRAAYKQGYAKAIWDATIIIAQAEDGYLPSDKTMEKWLEDQTKDMEKQGFKFEKIQDKNFGEMTKLTFDEDKSV